MSGGMDREEERFRALCENATDLIQSVSPEGRFLYVNRAWLETLGYSPDEVPGLSVFDVVHPDSREHCERVLRDVMRGKPATGIEAAFCTKDGRRIEVEGTARCVMREGKPLSTAGIFRDVTERKRARDELDRLFSLSLDLLCIAGTDGYFKRINPAFERVLGYNREELLSRSFIEFVHPDDREATLAEVENLAKGFPVVDFQNRYRAKDGSFRWLAWRSAPLPEHGLIYAVARDVTEQRRMQEQLARQAGELARSNADLEQFASVASHDLRAPLRVVANLTEWIEEDLPGELPDKVRQHITKLHDRVARMQRLIDDLLSYSRAGRERGEIVRVDSAAMIRELVSLLAPPEAFVVEVAPEMPVFTTAKAPLEQVFRNLLGNAIQHHDRADGKVVVSCRDRGERYEFSVRDDGPGIPAESQSLVFDMFHKLKPRGRVESSGIGLALVKRIVEVHGGQVRLESEPGRGATFRFSWPKTIEVDHAENPDR
jgi:PAS domain S-box-containing protein